ncbi:GNAT family N-acetyltransferase [Aquimarina sp. 2304DJ70-9]|uniref:GNAT family N-acetyltransferase n=1 Tax=Aquimarina penaris TaxID=3231044 RepID=UPI003461A131
MKIELVKAKETDKNFLLDLRKLTMVKHLEKAGIYLSDEEHVARAHDFFEATQILINSSERIGVLKCLETQNSIEIVQLQILPQYQGMDIGKGIANDVISKAQSKNKSVTLKVLKENPARYLYERIGFKITGEDQYEFHMKKEWSGTS